MSEQVSLDEIGFRKTFNQRLILSLLEMVKFKISLFFYFLCCKAA